MANLDSAESRFYYSKYRPNPPEIQRFHLPPSTPHFHPAPERRLLLPQRSRHRSPHQPPHRVNGGERGGEDADDHRLHVHPVVGVRVFVQFCLFNPCIR